MTVEAEDLADRLHLFALHRILSGEPSISRRKKLSHKPRFLFLSTCKRTRSRGFYPRHKRDENEDRR
jgi:hypothetical protein